MYYQICFRTIPSDSWLVEETVIEECYMVDTAMEKGASLSKAVHGVYVKRVDGTRKEIIGICSNGKYLKPVSHTMCHGEGCSECYHVGLVGERY